MKLKFADVLTADRRLLILRFLSEAPEYSLNTAVLQTALDSYGNGASRDQIETDAAWLAEQGLVDLEEVGPVLVAKLLPRGADVAAGRVIQPGVKRPGPRS